MIASVPPWVEIGQLHMRSIKVFTRWPWKLGMLVGSEIHRDEKITLASELLKSCDHLDEFTKQFREGLRGVVGWLLFVGARWRSRLVYHKLYYIIYFGLAGRARQRAYHYWFSFCVQLSFRV